MKALPLRVLSALVALGILFLSYHFGAKDGVFGLSSVFVLIVCFEYSKLFFKDRSLQILFFLASSFDFFLEVLLPVNSLWSTISILMMVSIFVLAQIQAKTSLESGVSSLGMAALGLFYCSWLPYFVIQILYLEAGLNWFIFFLCIVFIGDSTAYIVGSLFGRVKLLEKISPQKTVEGALGGMIGSVLVGVAGSFYLNLPLAFIIPLSILTGVLAQVGDLLESLFKRVAQVKDSGHIMPGHGGIMDRIDGLYFSAPFFYVMVTYFQS